MIPKPLKFLFSSSPSYLIFWVTQNCNARCAFCFNWEENLKKNHDLSIEEIQKIAKSYPHLKYLTLAGGEPTLRSDLPEIVSAFVQHSGLQICSLVTNGLKWESVLKQTTEVCRRHSKLAFNVGVSIDYLGKKHDEHRKAKGCWEGCLKVIQEIKKLRQTYPQVMVNAVGTYTQQSASSILETGKTIMETYQIPFILNLIRGEVEEQNLKEVNIHHYRQVACELLKIENKVIPKTTWQAPFRFALEELGIDNIYQSVTSGQIQSTCQAGRQAIVLESNGRLRLCEILPDHFGNVRDHDYNIPAMLNSSHAQEIITKILYKNCHCTWECINRANLAFDVTKWPKLFSKGFQKAFVARSFKEEVKSYGN